MVIPGEPVPPATAPLRRAARGKTLLYGTLVLLALGSSATYLWLQAGLREAEEAMSRHDLLGARNAAERFLRIAPGNTAAHMLAGNAFLQDDSLDSVEAARMAISHYAKIPDHSDLGAVARSLEGRAAFLVLQEPSRAERLFRRSVALNPDQFDSHYMLWQLDNMTERYFESEPQFRAVYRLCPVEERAFRLREWYSSQFSPLSACGQLDLMMQFRNESEPPSEEVTFRRLSAFLKYEPNEPNTAAALAQWHLRNLSRENALEVLDAIPAREQAMQSHFYAATLVETLIEVGQMERAGAAFSQWPSPVEGYQYYRIAGIHAQEVQGDLDLAASLFSRAVDTWPGPSDWPLINRLSRCLALQGRKDESQRMRLAAERVEGLSDVKIHLQVRQALGHLDDPDQLEGVVRFYESFHRDWEASAWREVISNLRKSGDPRHAFPHAN